MRCALCYLTTCRKVRFILDEPAGVSSGPTVSFITQCSLRSQRVRMHADILWGAGVPMT